MRSNRRLISCRHCGSTGDRRDLRRVGLTWYCRPCLAAGLVPGVDPAPVPSRPATSKRSDRK